MKIKTTQIIKKLKPNSLNYRIRVKNQIKLETELTDRVWWRFDVLDYCDNKKEATKSMSHDGGYFDWRDSKCLHFPPKKSLPLKDMRMERTRKPLFHIIKLKEGRYKIVWIRKGRVK
nr:MAG TPA: hypothetical protein [Caudoviricetes sp.]